MRPLLAATFAAFLQASAQTKTPSGPGLTIRSSTTLVQVNVVALDSAKHPAGDLRKEDFELFEDGHKRDIAVFFRDGSQPEPASRQPLPRGHFSNRLSPSPNGRAGCAIILLDYANTGFRNTARARLKALEVANRLGPSEKVGLYILDSGGLRIAVEPSTDRSRLIAALQTAVGLPAPCFQRQLDGLDDRFDDSMLNCGGDTPLAGEVKSYFVDKRLRDTLAVFEAISAHIAGLPGRKGLIWISSAFPSRIELRAAGNTLFPNAMGGDRGYDSEFLKVLDQLNNAGVSLYPVDPRGTSVAGGVQNADDFTIPTLDFFAERTGGISFHGRNDLDAALSAAIADVQMTYTLGFYAPRDPSRAGFHRLTVRSLRRGITLRHKEGYYVEPPSANLSTSRKRELPQALTALLDVTSVPLDATAQLGPAGLNVQIRFQPESLGLERKGDRWQGEVELVARFAAPDGRQMGTPSLNKLQFNLGQSKYEIGLRDGLILAKTLSIPRGATQVRLLVRKADGSLGSLTLSLADVPAN